MNIQNIEYDLDIELPKEYKNTLLNYPDGLPQSGFNIYGSEELLKDFESIISLNRFARKELRIDPKYFLIGGSGSGDWYFIDLSQDDSGVYYLNHEDNSFEMESRNLHEHIKTLIKRYAMFL